MIRLREPWPEREAVVGKWSFGRRQTTAEHAIENDINEEPIHLSIGRCQVLAHGSN